MFITYTNIVLDTQKISQLYVNIGSLAACRSGKIQQKRWGEIWRVAPLWNSFRVSTDWQPEKYVLSVTSSTARQHCETCSVVQPRPVRGNAVGVTSTPNLDRGQFFLVLNSTHTSLPARNFKLLVSAKVSKLPVKWKKDSTTNRIHFFRNVKI